MHQDYIMRLIERFMQALASIIAARRSGKHEEALSEIYRVSAKYLEADITTLMIKSPSELLNFFRSGDNLETDRCLICAYLLNEIAQISDASQPLAASHKLKVLSLHLFNNALSAEPNLKTRENEAIISKLKEDLK